MRWLVVLAIFLTPSSEAATITADQQELLFCRTIDQADAAYEAVSKTHYAEKNGLAQDRVGDNLKKILDDRDYDIFAILHDTNLRIEGWNVTVSKISSPWPSSSSSSGYVIPFEVMVPCKTLTTLKADITSSPELVGKLSRIPIGTKVLINASFIDHGGTHYDHRPANPGSGLEWSLTQSGSMQSPEYHINVQQLN